MLVVAGLGAAAVEVGFEAAIVVVGWAGAATRVVVEDLMTTTAVVG